MARFTLPRDLYHGKGSLETLKTLEGKKAMICLGGGSMKRNGFLDKAVAYLKEAGMDVEIFDGIEADPSVDHCYERRRGDGKISARLDHRYGWRFPNRCR